jgi:hypothetical protein
MTGPQEQFAELTRRTQENFKHLWEQWSQRSNELMKTMGSRSRSAGDPPGNPEEVLDAVFDFAENLIAQQRTFAKQMLRAASQGQQAIADVASTTSVPTSTTDVSAPRMRRAQPHLPTPPRGEQAADRVRPCPLSPRGGAGMPYRPTPHGERPRVVAGCCDRRW